MMGAWHFLNPPPGTIGHIQRGPCPTRSPRRPAGARGGPGRPLSELAVLCLVGLGSSQIASWTMGPIEATRGVGSWGCLL